MLESITATSVMGVASDFSTALAGPLLIVVGFGVVFAIVNWVAGRLGKRGGGKRRK